MMGRLFANLSLTSISRTSVGRETKLNCCNKGKAQDMKLMARKNSTWLITAYGPV